MKENTSKKIYINILYEDDILLVCEKPAGVLSHPDTKLKEPDLLSIVKEQNKTKHANDYQVCNRLDFNTVGLVMIGKTKDAVKSLNIAIANRYIQKYYHGVVIGYMPSISDNMEAYLLKDERSSIVRISETMVPNSQKIQTSYHVIKESNGLSLLEIELVTGKTHQIRAHFASIDHPLLGDPLYGNLQANKKYRTKTQLLFADRLVFSIPESLTSLTYLNGKVFQRHNHEIESYFQK